MKYNVGDKVRIKSLDWYNENKDEDGNVWLMTTTHSKYNFIEPQSDFCGKVVTIEEVYRNFYTITDPETDFYWTDEMIEGLAEEENPKPKFKVGDKVKDKNNRTWFIVRVSETFFDISSVNVPNAQGYFVPMEDQNDYELVPKYFSNEIEINNMKRNACQKCAFAVDDDNPHCGLRGFTTSFNVEWCSAENDKAPNGYELQEDGYFSWIKKKKEYPKTYEECCKVLGYDDRETYCVCHTGANERLFESLYRLKVCRDAYWLTAGQEMGLNRPWEPDGNPVYAITRNDGCIVEIETGGNDELLEFPTAEMRYQFNNNFNKEIEICKNML